MAINSSAGKGQRDLHRIEIHALELSAALDRHLSPRRVDQDAPHRLRRGGKEVGAILKTRLLLRLEQS
jgi:hypothetical protein